MIDRQPRSSWLVSAVVSGGIACAAIVVGLSVTAALAGAGPGGRMIPRTPPPPTDLPTLLYQLGVGSVVWYAAAIALPILIAAVRRVDADRMGLLATVGIAATVTAALVAVTSVVDYRKTYGGTGQRPPLAAYLPLSLRQHVLPWMSLMGIVIAIEARRRALQSRVERERLRAEVSRQRLIALSGQLRPHFLFNTLQAISTLIRDDPDAADEMLTNLSDLLRDVLRHRDSAFVRLGEEVRYARTWLQIAKARFGSRLTFDIDAPSELHGLSVPLFILQPLIENALGHGIGGRLQGGHVSLRARKDGEHLSMVITDNGAGLVPGRQRREGIGLTNTRERLAASFGANQSLTLSSPSSGGTAVEIRMPATLLPDADEAS